MLCHFATLAAHAAVLMTVPKCNNTETVLLKVQQVDIPATDRQLLVQVNTGGCDRCRTQCHCTVGSAVTHFIIPICIHVLRR